MMMLPFFYFKKMKLQNSPIQTITYQDQTFLLKRDDLLHSDFSGNKARKFYYFLQNNFPQIYTVVSYGSNQSNAMYSLSVLCKLKGWRFIYYTDHIPSFLQANPSGNYKYALQNGMEIRVQSSEFRVQDLEINSNELFINEGGANKEAEYGIKILADEIQEYKEQHNIHNLKIFLPSGTGTTALFLQKHLDDEVLTCACVGDEKYLKKQFLELEPNEQYHPTIIKTKKKYHFGKLYRENFILWKDIKKSTDIEFDLLYDPIGLESFLSLPKTDTNYLYIHQGGLKGNETMTQRYLYKYPELQN